MGDAHSSHQILLTLTLLIGSNDYHLQPNCETQRLTDQKLSSSIFPCCCSLSVRPSRMVTSPLYDVLGHTNHIFSESSWSQDIKTDITKCLILKYTNTNTQIHKYTNTAYYKVPERPNMWYIFEKRIVQRYQKLYSHVSNAQIQKYKYTNTQIHKYSI